MEQNRDESNAGKSVELAENLLKDAKERIQSINDNYSAELAEIERTAADISAASSSIERLKLRDPVYAGKISTSADGLKRAEDLLRELNKSLAERMALSRVERDKAFASIVMALEILKEMRNFNLRDPEYPQMASKTMDYLRDALDNLQTGETDESDIVSVTSIVARTLAALYPVSKMLENPPKLPSAPAKTAEKPPGIERRAAPRIAIEAEIGFQSETNFFSGFTEDISTGGLFIATYDTRGIGDRLNVNFTLPNGHFISADGIVRWVREFNAMTPDTMPGMGVQFESLSDDDRDAVNGFVSLRQPLFYDD